MKSLTALANACPGLIAVEGEGTVSITGITADSRKVEKGFLFVAVKGAQGNGEAYIPDAAAKGAVAILCARDSACVMPAGVTRVKSPNIRLALAKLAAAFHAPQPEWIAAVTGTDGKTSTADFFRQLWCGSGEKAAAIGTLGVTGIADAARFPAINTTPDPVLLQQILQALAQEDYRYVAMEASSHGLDQYRLDGAAVKAAAFTNLTRDHLDYHGTVEAYFTAKKRLFSELLPEEGTAVLNADDPHADALETLCRQRRHRLFRFGRRGREFRVLDIIPTLHGQNVTLELLGEKHRLELGLYGGFQVMNILAALGLYIGCGGEMARALSLIPQLAGVPGRLEKAALHPCGAPIFVDYAHTPAALENLLKTLRPHTEGKLHVVFGCGGDRDKGKRPQMGDAAKRLADRVIVTDDNPRSEAPETIRAEILAAVPEALEIGDRAEAIGWAVGAMKEGDLLVIAGKGHEKTQTYGTRVLPFDDAETVRHAVARLRQ